MLRWRLNQWILIYFADGVIVGYDGKLRYDLLNGLICINFIFIIWFRIRNDLWWWIIEQVYLFVRIHQVTCSILATQSWYAVSAKPCFFEHLRDILLILLLQQLPRRIKDFIFVNFLFLHTIVSFFSQVIDLFTIDFG